MDQMPSSSIKNRVYGFIRNLSSSSTVDEHGGDRASNGLSSDIKAEHCTAATSSNSFVSQCILHGKNGRKHEPEVYSGKTGLALPVLMVEPLSTSVRSAYSGPDGGLTEVGEMRQQPVANMANLDDELCLSFDGELLDEEEDTSSSTLHTVSSHSRSGSTSGFLGSCSSLVGPSQTSSGIRFNDADRYDWLSFNEERCFGLSTSLYERNPLTGINAGSPIADVFGIVSRDNNAILALADGVNWGEGARLAARCAVRGAIDHLNQHLFDDRCITTTDIFHALLGSFHAAHSLILQEGGLLTTLCVGVTAQLRSSDTWVLCVCNVGDSLCFVYNPVHGVREVTVASHNIHQMRDMRDAGGALGPVDGISPQLHNLTCSMTFVEPDDVVFITSDGISDNFDPVVGKFCVIKNADTQRKNISVPPRPVAVSVGSNGAKVDGDYVNIRACNATLPCVDAHQRHELMLLRMNDIISNGMLPPASSIHRVPVGGITVSSSTLCHNLVKFTQLLTSAKRRTLEDPELYLNEKRMTKSEIRSHRKRVRCRISEMPGKLDHASVVAFKVGVWPSSRPHSPCSLTREISPSVLSESNATTRATSCCSVDYIDGTLKNKELSEVETIEFNVAFESLARCDWASTEVSFVSRTPSHTNAFLSVPVADSLDTLHFSRSHDSACENSMAPKNKEIESKRAKRHARGTPGRHTLSVDVTWFKKLVSSRTTLENNSKGSRISGIRDEEEKSQSLSLRQRFRGFIGSSRNVRTLDPAAEVPKVIPNTSRRLSQSNSAHTSPKKSLRVY
ncbi:hypothetical protein AB6A40_003035 [Gnathostoma spinigerum]|uniref:PPM-type phosphatase domain-containing protein n=1 Tax=Gnathostoma spinigerum TaxID=75299 RepID=A0ABD6E9M2_9BILA